MEDGIKQKLQTLKWTKLQFNLKLLSDGELPKYTGSIFRGALCTTYRRIVCVQKAKLCPACPIRKHCSYYELFEKPITPESPRVSGETQAAANPFLIEPPTLASTQVKAGEQLSFNLILIGKAIAYLPLFLFTVQKMGKTGIAAHKTRFSVESVVSIRKCGRRQRIQDDSNPKEYRSPVVINAGSFFNRTLSGEHVVVDFLTPTRLIQGSKMQTEVSFELLMRSIFRRLNQLLVHYSGIDQPINFLPLVEQAKQVKSLATHLNTLHWERFSYRQKQNIYMDGILGTAHYTGNLSPFIPYLKLAEQLHVGKNTVFGMGKIEISVLTKIL